MVQDQPLSVTSLPEILFSDESQTIAPHSVIWLYCEVTGYSTESALIVTWLKNNKTLVHNAPHIRLRNYTSNSSFKLALIVEPFQTPDNGVYQCTAKQINTETAGRLLTLTGYYKL